MSWFGEQLSSITGKLTDFTKEVIIESSGILSPPSGDSAENSAVQSSEPEEYSENSLLRILKEKDFAIEQFVKEKEYYEKNIEELDEQHQEELSQLLLQRSHLTKENNELKERLSVVEASTKSTNEREGIKSPKTSNNPTLQDSKQNSDLLVPKQLFSEFNENHLDYINGDINLSVILRFLKNYAGSETIDEIVTHLKSIKNHLVSAQQTEKSENAAENIKRNIDKIDIYSNYLSNVLEHTDIFLPIVKESGLIFDLLNSKNICLENNVQALQKEIGDLNNAIKNLSEKENINEGSLVTDSSTQVLNNELVTFDQKDVSYAAVNTISLLVESKTSQTDQLVNCEKCSLLEETVKKLQTDVEHYIQKIHLCEQEVEYSRLLTQHTRSSISVQTETKHELDNSPMQTEIDKLKVKVEELQKELNERELNFNVQIQNEQFRCSNSIIQLKENKKLLEDREQIICEKSNEILSLKSKINELKEELDNVNVSPCQHSPDDNKECYKEKDDLQEKNMLKDLTYSKMEKTIEPCGTECLANDLKLHERLKNSELEKGRILCVLNEKSQECSTLKAEVHRLTAVVASEKQALLKLQQDNHGLKRMQQDALDPELTKEALKNLSRIIRDKDIEIDALKQKNNTLTSLIQQPSSSTTEHFQSVMEEHKNLTEQLNICKSEMEKYLLSCNSKDQECQKYLAEVQRLSSLLSCQSQKFDVLQQQHHSVAQQYEEKQKSLINTQNEMIALKQRVTDLEEQHVEMKEKYAELLNKINSDVLIQVHREEYSNKLSEIETLSTSLKEKDDLIHEKDCIIHELSQQIKKQKTALEEQEHINSDLKSENCELLTKIKDSTNSVQKLAEEKESTNNRLTDKQAELILQKEMNERLSMTINEKEFSIQSMGKKITSLSQMIQGKVSSSTESPYNCDIDQILAESYLMYSKAEHFQRERDESLLSLSQSQHENQELKEEIHKLRSAEDHLKSELDRLRRHLLQIEENYTAEALRAEEREKELRNQLMDLENNTRASAVINASHEASIQVSSLQEQLSMIAHQRDRALAQVSALDDKVQQYVASLNNLQLVLEQMEKGHSQKLAEVKKEFRTLLEKEKERCQTLERDLKIRQMQLAESSQALEAATRLSEQLDSKEEVIAILRCELTKAEGKVLSVSEQVEAIKSNTEGKVDRVVIKSLVLGYFSTPAGQKSEVVRLLARVLDFNQEEMEKAGIVVTQSHRSIEPRGLLSSWFGRLPSIVPASQPNIEHPLPRPPQKSFTSLFVQFLENESQPVKPISFPAEKMANEVTSKKNHSPKPQLPANSPFLLNMPGAFPVFSPVPVSDSNSSILKEVLK